MQHLSLDLVRVTEAAAIAAARLIGSGDKIEIDRVATEAMRRRLNSMEFAGKVVIGEGEKDGSFGLYAGEMVGKYTITQPSSGHAADVQIPYLWDIAVDPVDGTSQTAVSGPEAMSVIAVAEHHTMFSTSEYYMNKLAYGPILANKIQLNINNEIEDIISEAARAVGRKVSEMVVCVLKRPRHDAIIDRIRKIGARLQLINDCDVSGAISTCLPDSGIDILYGIGGAPESVITACAIKCLGGVFQAQFVKDDNGCLVPNQSRGVLRIKDLVNGECLFAATGITAGSMLDKVRPVAGRGPVTHSVFMRSESHTVRWMTTVHGN